MDNKLLNMVMPQNNLSVILQNPEFKKFVEENKDKTPEEIVKKYNIDPSILKFLK